MIGKELREAIESLDQAVPRTGAAVKLHQYGGGPDESQVVANARGYLRLGIEFLKAGIAEPERVEPGEVEVVSVDLDYLLTGDSSIGFDWFERREGLEPEGDAEQRGIDPWAVVIAASLASAVLLSIVGLVTVVRWLWSLMG